MARALVEVLVELSREGIDLGDSRAQIRTNGAIVVAGPDRIPGDRCWYRCSRCRARSASGPLPAGRGRRGFPIPPGWSLRVKNPLNPEDQVLCPKCAEASWDSETPQANAVPSVWEPVVLCDRCSRSLPETPQAKAVPFFVEAPLPALPSKVRIGRKRKVARCSFPAAEMDKLIDIAARSRKSVETVVIEIVLENLSALEHLV
jgi:hypothetical protein